MRRGGNNHEVAQLREQLTMEKAKLEQLTWKEEIRAKDIREARERILSCNSRHQEMIAEVENLKSALADVVKESRNKGVSLIGTAWNRAPPEGLTDFINQVDCIEAEGLMALAMASSTSPQQDLVPTSIASFSEVEVPPLRPAPVTPVRKIALPSESIQASGYSGGCSGSKTMSIA
eukprot:6490934-Amphidinium_carterae.3